MFHLFKSVFHLFLTGGNRNRILVLVLGLSQRLLMPVWNDLLSAKWALQFEEMCPQKAPFRSDLTGKSVMEAQFVRRSDVGDGRANFIYASLCLLHGWREKREKEKSGVMSPGGKVSSKSSSSWEFLQSRPSVFVLQTRLIQEHPLFLQGQTRSQHLFWNLCQISESNIDVFFRWILSVLLLCNDSLSSHRSADWAWAGEGFQANVGTNHKATHAGESWDFHSLCCV